MMAKAFKGKFVRIADQSTFTAVAGLFCGGVKMEFCCGRTISPREILQNFAITF